MCCVRLILAGWRDALFPCLLFCLIISIKLTKWCIHLICESIHWPNLSKVFCFFCLFVLCKLVLLSASLSMPSLYLPFCMRRCAFKSKSLFQPLAFLDLVRVSVCEVSAVVSSSLPNSVKQQGWPMILAPFSEIFVLFLTMWFNHLSWSLSSVCISKP